MSNTSLAQNCCSTSYQSTKIFPPLIVAEEIGSKYTNRCVRSVLTRSGQTFIPQRNPPEQSGAEMLMMFAAKRNAARNVEANIQRDYR